MKSSQPETTKKPIYVSRFRVFMAVFFSAIRKRNLLRQRKDVHVVAAGGRVRLWSHAHADGSDRAATGGDGDVMTAVGRIRHGAADHLRGKPRLPHDLSVIGIERPQVTVHTAVEQEA